MTFNLSTIITISVYNLLTEQHLDFLSLTGGCPYSVPSLIRVYTCQNATLLEITCCGSCINQAIHVQLMNDVSEVDAQLVECRPILGRRKNVSMT